MAYKPSDDSTSEEYRVRIEKGQLYEFYDNWKAIVEEYAQLIPKQPERDFILEQYQNEFFDEFELTDEDADTLRACLGIEKY